MEEKYHRMRREIVGCTRHANSLCKDRKWPRTSSTENADKCKKEAEELDNCFFIYMQGRLGKKKLAKVWDDAQTDSCSRRIVELDRERECMSDTDCLQSTTTRVFMQH